ncbi:hypothetical protein Va1_241 [Vibrio phage Va1]|nr:hypothetical protein Va1_241 [Vibrio phage Va1]
MKISDIIKELNQENGSNFKISVLKKYKDNILLQRVLKMAYDRVAFTYGMSLKSLEKFEGVQNASIGLYDALDYLEEDVSTRKITGHKALQAVANILACLSEDDADVVRKIIDRDLKINLGKTQINKVFKNLIVKPVYMRCGVYNDKTKSKINPNKSIVQLKADGTYRDFTVHGENVDCTSRSGEVYEYPLINEELATFNDGHYHGELTVVLTDELFDIIKPKLEQIDKKNKTNCVQEITEAFEQHKAENREYILPRSIGNGLINSDDIPHKNLKLELWDFITPEEYANAQNKVKNKTPYSERFEQLKTMISNIESDTIFIIPHKYVTSISEALTIVSEWMNIGYEGGVLKDLGMIFRDGTSPQQLKLKLEIDLEVRCVGYNEGRKGTKREGKIGSLQFCTDDLQIKGSCSGFSDDELDEFTKNFHLYKDRIFTVQFNDLTKARGNDYYALSHPRFIEWRTDKSETDTLERAFELREMAMCLS